MIHLTYHTNRVHGMHPPTLQCYRPVAVPADFWHSSGVLLVTKLDLRQRALLKDYLLHSTGPFVHLRVGDLSAQLHDFETRAQYSVVIIRASWVQDSSAALPQLDANGFETGKWKWVQLHQRHLFA